MGRDHHAAEGCALIGMCGRGRPSLARGVDWPPGDWFGSAVRSAVGTGLPWRLDPAGRCWRGSGRGRSDRSGSQCHRSRTGPSHPPVRRGFPADDGLPARYRSTRPAVINRTAPGRRPRPPVPGSQRQQAPGYVRRQRAMVCATRWPIRPHPATCTHTADVPEKRKVGGSTPPLTTL